MVTLSQRKISLIFISLGQSYHPYPYPMRAHPYPLVLILIPRCSTLSPSLSLKRLPSPLCSASGGEGFSDGRIQNSRGFGDGGICYNGSMGASAAAGSSAVAVWGFAGGRIQSNGGVGASTAAGSRAAVAWGDLAVVGSGAVTMQGALVAAGFGAAAMPSWGSATSPLP
jgi:hypothetical protein